MRNRWMASLLVLLCLQLVLSGAALPKYRQQDAVKTVQLMALNEPSEGKTTASPVSSVQPVVTPAPAITPQASMEPEPGLIQVEVGASLQLLATSSAKGAKPMFYTKTGELVAVTSSGLVTGIQKGQAEVVALFEDGSRQSFLLEVVQGVKVTSVVLDQKSARLAIGQSIRLGATVLPEDASTQRLVFVSSNPRVASVDQQGVVKGLIKGKATISVYTLDGYFKAVCEVVVENKRITSLRLDAPVKLENGQKLQLKPVYGPKDATQIALVYTSSDPSIASVNNRGVVTAKVPGTVKITVSAAVGTAKAVCTLVVFEKPATTPKPSLTPRPSLASSVTPAPSPKATATLESLQTPAIPADTKTAGQPANERA